MTDDEKKGKHEKQVITIQSSSLCKHVALVPAAHESMSGATLVRCLMDNRFLHCRLPRSIFLLKF
jgi:hypothetical protein